MTTAAQDPAFPEGGAPISALIDFDGTISLGDVGDILLARYARDKDEARRLDALYLQGAVSSRELMRWDMEALPRDVDLLLSEVDRLPLDESFIDLVRTVEQVGGATEVVSDGLGFHVERMLARLGLAELPIATNIGVPGERGGQVEFPYGHPACFVCGTCKRERVRRHQSAGRAVIFVGDGASDRYAAHHADVVFAKDALAVYCESAGIPHEAWSRLADVARWLEEAVHDGRLPSDAEAFEAWAARARPEVTTFICGPEVWGRGAEPHRAELLPSSQTAVRKAADPP